jgi:hypothetical protein
MLAERLNSLEQRKIQVSKVLIIVTDNGSNMTKAITTCKQLHKKQSEAVDETIDSDGGSGTGTSSNEERVKEVEADGADVVVDIDSHNDVPESVKKREGMAQ